MMKPKGFARGLLLSGIGRTFALTIGLCALLGGARATTSVPTPLPSPDLKLVTNGQVEAIALQADGGVVFGGTFSSVNGVARANIARQSPDGTLDMNWNPSADGTVLAIATDAPGNAVYVGGSFRTIGATRRANIAKVAGDMAGALDPAWNPVVSGVVRALAVDDSRGVLLAGGDFSIVAGQAHGFVAKFALAGTGAVDAAWNPAASAAVYTLAVDPAAGALYVGGQFTSIGGQSRNYLAKLSLDGTGAATAWNPMPDSYVRALALDAASATVYAGGSFGTVSHVNQSYLVKLSADSGAMRSGWLCRANGEVRALALNGAGSLYAAGAFTQIGNQPRSYVARLSAANGLADVDWDSSADAFVDALAANGDTVFIGGAFAHIAGEKRLGFASFTANSARAAVDAESKASVLAIVAQSGGGTIVGGDFEKADQVARANLLRLLPDGTLDPDWNPSADGKVNSLLEDAASSSIFVGGAFQSIGGQARSHIARLAASGSVDPVWKPGSEGPVLALAADATGQFVYAGGDFIYIGGQFRSRLAKLAVAGSGAADPTWDPGADQYVNCLAFDPNDGSLFVGGGFSSVGLRPRHQLAKLDGGGSGAAVANWVSPVFGSPYALVVDPVSDVLYIGGNITSGGTNYPSGVARVAATGTATLDVAWNPKPNNNVLALALDPASRSLYLAGKFTRVGTQQRAHLAKVSADGIGAVASDWYPSTDDDASALSVDAIDGTIAVGGLFSRIGDESRQSLAVLPLGDPFGTNIFISQVVPATSVAGQPIAFSLHMQSDAGAPTGSAVVTAGTTSCSAVLDADGNGHCTLTLPNPGTFIVNATYAGDGPFAASAASMAYDVDRASTSLSIVEETPDPAPPAQLVTFTVNLTVNSPGGGTPSGHILVSDGVNACDIVLGDNQCSVGFATHGIRTVTAKYMGDAIFNSSVATTTHIVNRLPVAAADAFHDSEDTTLAVDAAHGLLANDSDQDGDTLSMVNSGPVSPSGIGGTVVLAADGSFVYTPPSNAHGQASFDYTISDGYQTATATATITVDAVDDLPVAVDDSFDTNEDTVLVVDVAHGLLANDSDVDGDSLVVATTGPIAASGIGGSAVLSADGSFTYTPPPNADGQATFDYSISDGHHLASATVTINVAAVDDPPEAAADAYGTNEDTTLVVDAADGLLANDNDGDGDTLVVTSAGTVAPSGIGGTVVVAANGSFTYTPPPDANGQASFDYTVGDGHQTATATVTITVGPVNDPPAFQLADAPASPPGTQGLQVVPQFASVTAFGPPNESGQHVAQWIVRPIDDPAGVVSSLHLSVDGTLDYVLSGRPGLATFGVVLQDDGGTANGGSDIAPEQQFTISAVAGADLSISIDDHTSFAVGGATTTYTIVVSNAGPDDVFDARIVDALPFNLTDASWTCVPQGNANCAAEGIGSIDETIDVASGATLTYEVVATVLAMPEQPVVNTASVTAPSDTPDADPTNDSATDIDAVGIYANGFD